MKNTVDLLIIFLMLFVLLIFTVLIFHKGRKKYSNVVLAIYFISQIIGISSNLYYFGIYTNLDIQVLSFAVLYTWLPLFYLYTLALLYSEFRIQKKHLLHFIPALVVLVSTVYLYYIKDYKSKLLNGSFYEIYTALFQNFNMLFNLQVVFYNILIIIAYRKYLKAVKQEFSIINSTANNWVKTSIFGFLLACIIVQFGNYSTRFHILNFIDWYLVGNAAFLLFFNILFYKAIISPDFFGTSQIKEKYKYSNLSETEAGKIIQELEVFMKENKPFTDSALSLKGLSKMVNISERHVSQALNEYKKQNFFDFINMHRVNYAMELLRNKENARRTMLDILFDSGFNSKSSFNTAFKKYSGYTPSDFRKIHI